MASATQPNVKPLSVSELTTQVKELLEEGLARVWVVGEITGWRPHGSGHVYLSLKDAGAVLPAVLWRNTVQRLQEKYDNGMEVLVRGRLSVYLPQGKYQLVIDEIQPKGLGAQDLALKQLKEKLQKLGWFAPERKKELPRFPRQIALVTSPTGAAIRDMLETLGRRWPTASVWVCPVRVQGDLAPGEIAAAITRVNALACADVLILGRGGGSSEDLSAFNQESVAQAIFDSVIPVVSAVGHEIDVTVADLVADRRALTPTDAAVQVTPDRSELLIDLQKVAGRLRDLLVRKGKEGQRWLNDLASRRVFRYPLERIQNQERRLDELEERLTRAVRQRLGEKDRHLAAQANRLQGLSPLNVLARGYSLTRSFPEQTVLRQADQVKAGDVVETVLQHGSFFSRVVKKPGRARGSSISSVDLFADLNEDPESPP